MIKKRTSKTSAENQRADKKKKLMDEDHNRVEDKGLTQVLEEITSNHVEDVETELNNLPNSAKNEKNNSILAVSTRQNKKAQLGIHQTIINANREEKQDDTYLDRITSTNTNEFDEMHDKKKKDLGPTKVSKSVRVTSRMDYQPDICKDYYETGFCGYGDNCKFAHIREQHVSSIEHSKKWENEQKKKLESQTSNKDMRAEGEEQLPHACYICKKSFSDPVVTICGHFFCSKCAMEKYNAGKNPNCQCCGNNTKGVFNTAHKLNKKNKN